MKKVLVTCGLLFSLSGWGQTLPYQNPELSPAERAKDLVKRLTLEEKALLMCDDSEAIPRLGIKKFNWWSEALHGVANQGNVTVFPEPVGMAASFNDKLVFDISMQSPMKCVPSTTSAYATDWRTSVSTVSPSGLPT